MGWQVIRQPDGLLAIFSSVTDTWIVYDATEQDVVNEFVNAARRDARRQIRSLLAKMNAGQRPWHQFTMTFDEANRKSRAHHGVHRTPGGKWKEPPEERS